MPTFNFCNFTKLALIVVVCCCSLIFSAFADNYRLTQYTVDDGLSQSEVTHILQDSKGYLWIGTTQGLNRFDGYRFNTIQSNDGLLFNNAIGMLFEDSSGNLWVSSGYAYNFVLRAGESDFSPLQMPDVSNLDVGKYAVEGPGFVTASEAENGDIYFSTALEIYHYQASTRKISFLATLHHQIEEGKHLIRKTMLYRHYLLIATSDGLFALDLDVPSKAAIHLPHSPQNTNELSANVKHLSIQGSDLLVGTVEGLYRYSLVQLDNDLKNPPQQPVNSAIKIAIAKLNIWNIIAKNDYFLLATNDGVYRWNGSDIANNSNKNHQDQLKRLFRYSYTRFYTSDDDVRAMIKDLQGNFWLGSRSDGLFRWTPNELQKRKFDQNSGLSNDQVWKLLAQGEDRVWVGTENGLNLIHKSSGKIETFLVNPDERAVISESTIYDMELNGTDLWLYTAEGIRIFDTKKKTMSKPVIQPKDEELFSKSGIDLYFVDSDHLLILNGEGVYLHQLSTHQTKLIEGTNSKGNIKNRLTSVIRKSPNSPNHLLLAGIDRLVDLDLTNYRFTDIHTLPKSDQIRTTPQSVITVGQQWWISYPGYGIAIIDSKTHKEQKWISESSLNTNTAMDFFRDKQKRIWVSSNEGLLQIDPVSYSSRLFDANDGLNSSEMNGGALLDLGNGGFMVGSTKGVLEVSPQTLARSKAHQSTIQISDLHLLSRKIPAQMQGFNNYQLVLTHEDFGVDIEFSALDFRKPKQVAYRYWMEGAYATNPVEIHKSDILLPKLAPGKTDFFVSAFDFESGGFGKPARLTIIVKSAPWNSPLAWFGYIVFTLSVLFYIGWLRWQRLSAQKLAHKQVKSSEQRLKLALQGSKAEMWDWRAVDNKIYQKRYFDLANGRQQGVTFERHIEEIHPADRGLYRFHWHQFINGIEDDFSHDYRLKNNDGVYCWYSDLGTITEWDESGRPLRVTGTYTDITESKADKDKVELFHSAFENTRDLVFIVDFSKNLIAANRAFYRTTEYKAGNINSRNIGFLRAADAQAVILPEIFAELENGNSWEGEATLLCQFRTPLPVKLSASSFIQNEEHLHYVFAMTDISVQKEAENKLRKLANYDTLTGLPNRALLIDRLEQAILTAARKGGSLALLFVDLDRFKQVNDTLGHDVGDLLLVSIARVLKQAVRVNDTVSRMGGDEFVVLLEGIESIDVINRICQSFLDGMAKLTNINGHQINISSSVGIALYPDNGITGTELLKNADNAMYYAKNAGRNNFKYFQKSMNETAVGRMNLEHELRAAVKNEDFFLMYQPQFRCQTGELVGFEGLARWRDQNGEIVPPAKFITMAEEIGLILEITEQLVRSGVQQLSKWHQLNKKVGLAINLSARHLHHYDLPAFMSSLIAEDSFDPSLFEFELTESVMMKEIESTQDIFNRLASMKIELALDDFGTGYSSLKYLNELPICKVKIDRSFVFQIGQNRSNEVIIETVVALAQALGLKTVAEGVETIEQKHFLENIGVDYLQGFLLGKPMSVEDADRLLGK